MVFWIAVFGFLVVGWQETPYGYLLWLITGVFAGLQIEINKLKHQIAEVQSISKTADV